MTKYFKKNAIYIFVIILISAIAIERFAGSILSSAGLAAATEYLSYYEIYKLKSNVAHGDAEAAKKLSRYYGIWKNDIEFERYWLRRGAELHDLEAQYNLGRALYWSSDFKQEGIQWLIKSADSGYRPSIVFIDEYTKEVVKK